MRIHLLPLGLVSGLLAITVPAAAADRSFTVTGFTKIRVDGPFQVKLTTGTAPFARARGARSALDRVAISVQGGTLVIHPDRSAWGGYPGDSQQPVEISLGTHELSSVWINGAGSIAIDRVRGLGFALTVDGPGSASIASADVDQLRVNIAGTGAATIAGKAPRVTASVRGSALFDGSNLASKDASIMAEGPASVKLSVANAAKVDAFGTSLIQLSGNPACTTRLRGSATVNGCKRN